jgi:uncharacterized membrane protein (DUF373 family)
VEDGNSDTQERADSFPAPTEQVQYRRRSGEVLANFSSRWLDYAETIIYVIVGIAFLIGALCALGYSFWSFYLNMTGALSKGRGFSLIAPDIIQFVSDLLLVLIIMEVLSTVLHYLRSHTTSLRPFLFIGIVSATRGILSIGARLSVGANTGGEFNHDMIELGVNAAVVLALGITIKLLGRHLEDGLEQV